MSEPKVSTNPLRRLKSSLTDLRERHRERHQPTGFGFVFADRVDYLDPVRWDAVAAPSSFFLRREVLRVIEEHGPENIVPRYALIFRGGKPVAALAVQIVTVTGERLRRRKEVVAADTSAGLLRRMLAPAARKATQGLQERVLVAGNLLSWGFHGIAFAEDEDPQLLWPAISEAVYRIRRAERLSGQTDLVMIKDLTTRQLGTEALHRFSYRPMETEPNMVLEIDANWRTYPDYLAALDAKYRRKVKDQNKKLAAAGCTIEQLTDVQPHTRRLHELYLAVHGNASVRLVTLRENYLGALAKAVAENFRCTVIRRGTEIVGFVTSVRDGDTAIGYYIGFDREVVAATGAPIYLSLLHATIADAIAWRCTRLSLGRTALEPKAGLGAKPEPMSIWLRHRVPALNWMIRGFLGSVPHDEAPERSPFKATSNEMESPSN
ncbi:MAG: GNAT family N-acetyltransferase [Opitutaceae bacterium]